MSTDGLSSRVVKFLSLVGFATLVLVGCDREGQAEPELSSSLIVATSAVSMERQGTNDSVWRAGFDVGLTAEAVEIVVRVRLIPGPGVTRPQLDRLKQQWESAAEAYWNDACALAISGEPRAIRLDLQFQDADPHHTVVVRNDPASGVDQLNWSRYASARVIAHEVGHMLGAYDDYPGGAQQPTSPRADPGSLMGGSPDESAVVKPHHFELIATWARRFSDEVTVVATAQ